MAPASASAAERHTLCQRHPRACRRQPSASLRHKSLPQPLAAPSSCSPTTSALPRDAGLVRHAFKSCEYACGGKDEFIRKLNVHLAAPKSVRGIGTLLADNGTTLPRMHPSLRRAWEEHRRSDRRGVGVLLTGQVRTLPLHSEVRDSLRFYFRSLARGGRLRIFAALQLNCTYAGAGFDPAISRRRNMETSKSKKHNEFEVGLVREHVPRQEAEAALASLGIEFEATYTSAATLRGSASSSCGSFNDAVQWRGVALAYAMLERYEHATGLAFAWVVRARPDVCYMPLGVVAPALGANLDPLSLGCVHDDVLAIVPRWTAHVLAGTHQSIGDCSLDHRSCAFDPVFAGAYGNTYLRSPARSSLRSSIWQVHALRHGFSFGLCAPGVRPMLVRPGNKHALSTCSQWLRQPAARATAGRVSPTARSREDPARDAARRGARGRHTLPRTESAVAEPRSPAAKDAPPWPGLASASTTALLEESMSCGLRRVVGLGSALAATALAQPLALLRGVPWLAYDESFVPLLGGGSAPQLLYINTGARIPKDWSTILMQFAYPKLAPRSLSVHLEANPQHADSWHQWVRLPQKSEAAMVKGRTPTGAHQFLPYAVAESNHTLHFRVTGKLGATSHRQGGGHVKMREQPSAGRLVSVPGLDFASWLAAQTSRMAHSTANQRPHTVLKLDIEGAEEAVLPHLFATSAVCLLDEVFFDCHLSWAECNAMMSALRGAGVATHWANNVRRAASHPPRPHDEPAHRLTWPSDLPLHSFRARGRRHRRAPAARRPCLRPIPPTPDAWRWQWASGTASPCCPAACGTSRPLWRSGQSDCSP